MGKTMLVNLKKTALLSLLLAVPVMAGAAVLAESSFITHPVGHGAYELSLDTDSDALFVSTSPSFTKGKENGIIYRLNPDNLLVDSVTLTQNCAFASAK